MNKDIIVKQKGRDGRTRFYIVPIETEAGFKDLVKFVSQEFRCELGDVDNGPGTMVQRGKVDGKCLVFVMSDSTGIQFFAENEADIDLAERVARSVESRCRTVMEQAGPSEG